MAIRCYLAMTAAEFRTAEVLPPHPGWMACHFSGYSTGISNLPQDLPAGAMVILNDRTPVQGHDPQLILGQLTELAETFSPACFLLDLQRPDSVLTAEIVRLLTQKLPCPTAVTELYARETDAPVLLSPCPLLKPLSAHIADWKGREIWLEAAPEAQTAIIDTKGCQVTLEEALPDSPEFTWETLHCSYRIQVQEDRAIFHLRRNKAEVDSLLSEAEKLGITCAVGLYQQLAPLLL